MRKSRPISFPIILSILFLTLSISAARTVQAAFFDSKLQWRTLQTQHFNIHYYEGEEDVAYRMTVIAEKIYDELTPVFKWKPWGRTEVVITDTTDISNGITSTLPYNYILLLIAPPPGDSALNYYDNWLEDLFRHEFTHTLHLDMYGGSTIPLRWILGRIVTPNGLTPGWVREGIATEQEGLTGKGRPNSSFSEMMLRTDILNNQFLGLDKMAGNQFVWPSYNAAYIYGGMFWTYLAQKYGKDKIVEFSKRYSDSLWLFSLNNKARKTFGNRNFFKLHREWKEELTAKYQKQKKELEAQGLTSLKGVKKIAGVLEHPTLSPDGKYLIYSQTDYYHKPEIRMRRTDGTGDIRLTNDRTGNQYSFSPDGKKIVYSAISRYKKFYQYYDLFELDLKTKKSTQITYGGRAFHPDYSPDGKKIVYVKNHLTTTQLFLWDLEKKEGTPLTKPEKAQQFSNPRFSPDGKCIAVSLWRNGNRNIYLFDLKGNILKQVTQDEAIDNHPSFSPDGKDLFYTSDRTGITNVYVYHLSAGKTEQVTNVLTGVFEPSYRDGKIYLKYYFGRGYDLKVMDFRTSSRTPEKAGFSGISAGEGKDVASQESGKNEKKPTYFDLSPTATPDVYLIPKKYNPFKKLFIPRFVQPGFFFTDNALLLSANIGSSDPIGRHIWWGGPTYRTDAKFVGGNFLYSYNRFWPSVFVSFNDFVVSYGDLFRNGTTFFEERTAGTIGTALQGYGWGKHLFSFFYSFENRSAQTPIPPEATTIPSLGRFAGLGLHYQFNRATTYPASISLEGGPRLIMDLRINDHALGSSENDEQVIFSGDLREYAPLPWNGHVLAFRLAGGIAWGDQLLQGTFRLGSAIGESILSGPTPRLYPLRGLPQITFAGERALLVSGEYRLPLIAPQVGAGTGPIFLKNFYMVFFADYGSVWNGGIDFNNFLLGVGAELRGDFVLGYGLPLTGRLGYGIIAVGRDFIQGLTDPLTGTSLENGTLILELGTSF